MAARSQKRAGDVTGRQAEVLAEQNKEELSRRAEELSMFTATKAAAKQETVDLTVAKAESRVVVNESGDLEEIQDVGVEEPIVEFRVSEDLEKVTIGQGNHYDFEEGRTYRAPRYVRDHLEEKGFIWH